MRFRRDIAVTRLLRGSKLLLDQRSYVTLPDSEAQVHLVLRGRDMEAQHERVIQRDGFSCHGCVPHHAIGADGEVDHIQSKGKGGGDELPNLRWVCVPFHRKRHVHVQWSGKVLQEAL